MISTAANTTPLKNADLRTPKMPMNQLQGLNHSEKDGVGYDQDSQVVRKQKKSDFSKHCNRTYKKEYQCPWPIL